MKKEITELRAKAESIKDVRFQTMALTLVADMEFTLHHFEDAGCMCIPEYFVNQRERITFDTSMNWVKALIEADQRGGV